MTCKINIKKGVAVMKNKILFIAFIAVGSLFLTTLGLQAQSPSPSPSTSGSGEEVTVGGYKVTANVELGVRGLEVNGYDSKYRSDFNYRPGFRIFDSSFLMETEKGKGRVFDSLLINSSGWNSDPTGFVRVNMEKLGAYRFDANVRRVHYFNQVSNFALGYKPADTKRNFGDFDLTVFPQSENLRLRFGASFYDAEGTMGFTVRTRDVFPVTRNINSKSVDLRAGVDTKLAGFKLSLTGGVRQFEDETRYVITSPNLGFVPTDINVINALDRAYPIKGDTKYGLFTFQRTFAERLDITGRFIYSITDRGFNLYEIFSGTGPISRTNPTPIFIDKNLFEAAGSINRPQSRGDFGVTYAVTNKFRISNTFSFDQFSYGGDSNATESLFSRLISNGTVRPPTVSNTLYYRADSFKRFVNTVEGDYQFSPRFGINVGYRYSHRKIEINGFNFTPASAINNPSRLCSVSTSDNPRIFCEEEENSTNTLLIGTRVKPRNNWSIFADLEYGEADNAFTRLTNYNFTNFRVRSNWNYKQFTFNLSGIVRNNENPSLTSAIRSGTGAILIPEGELVSNVKSRVFSAYVDWAPDPRWTFSGGYTYHHLTSETDIVVPLAALTPGFSQYFMRDNYAFIDVSAQPIKRVSVYASYRFNNDRGQGDKVSTAPQFIVSSYPFKLHMPEIRVAVRLTRNIDWNVGYQYYDYRENLLRSYFEPILPNQNYNAHMPYTSLRIYFGRRE
jgi:hypothetical protein